MSTPRKRQKNFDERIQKKIKEKHVQLAEKISPEKAGMMASYLDLDYIIKNKEIPWNGTELSKNPQITFSFVKDHPEWEWDWFYLTRKFTSGGDDLFIIRENADEEWDWDYLSEFVSDWGFISEFFDKPWDIEKLSERDDFDFSLIEQDIDAGWNFRRLVDANDFGIEILRKYSECEWPWFMIHKSVNFDWDMVREFPEEDWFWSDIHWTGESFNNIPYDIFIEHHEKINLRSYYLVGRVDWEGAPEEKVLEIVPFQIAIQILPLSLDRVYELIGERGITDNIDVFEGPMGRWRKNMLIAEESGKEKAAFKIQWWWKGILEDPNHPKGYSFQEKKIKKLLDTQK